MLSLLLAGCATTVPGGLGSAQQPASEFLYKPESSYVFKANAQKDGKSVCTETWFFKQNNAHTTHSGEQITNYSFRIEDRDTGKFLITTKLSSNGKADCLGKTSPTAGNDREVKILINIDEQGAIQTCFPPGLLFKNDENILSCFGSLTPSKSSAS